MGHSGLLSPDLRRVIGNCLTHLPTDAPGVRWYILQSMPTKPNVWEFVRNENGSYAVFQNGKLLADAIPEERREDEFCIRFGFCGHEYEEIVRHLRQSGKCTLNLGSLD